ncbi:flagellar hook-length control protein FliK [Methylocaldum sp. MU1018]
MDIRPPVLIQASPLLQAGAPSLKLGDVLKAVVQARLEDHLFLLRLDSGGRTLTARSNANLQPGQIIELEVIKPGMPSELRILPRDSGSPAPEPPVRQALRLFLPKQEPLADVVEEVRLLAAQAKQTAALPAPATQALDRLLASIPGKSELTKAEGVENAVRNSGVFLEAKLAGQADFSPGFADSDFKAQLLRVLDTLKTLGAGPKATPDPSGRPTDAELQTALTGARERTEAAGSSEAGTWTDELQHEKNPPSLRPYSPPTASHERALETSAARRMDSAPPDEFDALAPGRESGAERIAQKVEAALAKVITDQLASLPANDGGASLWRLEIPFTDGPHGDTVKLLIAEDAKSGDPETANPWSINVELHPPGLGTFSARLILKGGRIDAYLWSDTAATSDLIRAQCEHLRARLQGAGLTVGQLTALDRPPPSPFSAPVSPPLLDLRA